MFLFFLLIFFQQFIYVQTLFLRVIQKQMVCLDWHVSHGLLAPGPEGKGNIQQIIIPISTHLQTVTNLRRLGTGW